MFENNGVSPAQRPANESERLDTLRAYRLLDTPSEQVFDDLTELAATLFNVPFVIISLIDDCRQYFKSVIGLPLTETSRDVSFCAHALLQDPPLVVLDTLEDSRFCNNPLVVGEPLIRFYAGALITVGAGIKLGTFCILDRVPRKHLTLKEEQALQRFASLTSQLIEVRLLPEAVDRLKGDNKELARVAQKENVANKAKTDFLSNMSHEIRTPMSGVLGMIQLLGQTALTPEQSGYVTVAESSGRLLLSIVDDVLDLSKIESGKLVIEALEFSVHRLLQDVGALWEVQAHNKGLSFNLVVDDSIPPRWGGDPTRLRQVLNNLLSNSIKFTSSGGITLKVEYMTMGDDPAMLRFVVIDTGVGIQEDQVANLFQPFVQADTSTTRKYGGSGLGLSICKHLVEMMGGTIAIVAAPESSGSTIWFTLAMRREEGSGRSASKAISKEKPVTKRAIFDAPATTTDIGILVVEDNLTNRLVIQAQLGKLGYKANVVFNGKEAVDAVQQGNYRLILMDCEMPIMDGYQSSKRIRELGYDHIQIIALTAHAMTGHQDRSREAGMDYFLSKPLDIQRLQRVLEERCPRLRQ